MADISTWAFNIGTRLIPLTIAIVFHEVAHGRVAKFFGDSTASDMGRLSFNPVRHIDPVGTLILPMMLALSGAPVFGWAKPVPVNQFKLRNPRWHMVAVAAAGPLMNILLAFLVCLAVVAINPVAPLGEGSFASQFLMANLSNFLMINLFLAVFNMLPIPPFDGSKVLAGLLPPALGAKLRALDRYALPIMLLFLVVIPLLLPQYNVVRALVVPPVTWLLGAMASVITSIFGGA
jgi:Zn-dependent protease